MDDSIDPYEDADQYAVYDATGAVRFSQDGALRAQDKVAFTTYNDPLHRPTVSGIAAYSASFSTLLNQTSQSFELVPDNWIQVNVYDVSTIPSSYPWTDLLQLDASVSQLQLSNTKGRLSASAFRTAPTEPWHYLIYGYDDEGNVTDHYTCGPKLECKKFEYDYDLMNHVVKVAYQAGVVSEQVFYWYWYDKLGYLEHLFGNTVDDFSTAVREAEWAYTPSGQVETLVLGAEPVQTINYSYNARGWLTGINNLNTVGSGADVFAQSIDRKSVV